MFTLYQIFYIIFVIFYMLTFVFKKRRREGVIMRLGFYPDEIKEKLKSTDNIWIHAVSVGEVMAAKALAESIKKDLQNYRIVISTITETGNRVAKKIMGDDAAIIYLPLDLTFAIKRAIKIIRPAIFIMIETEIWPNLLRGLKINKIPILLSNGRISERSYRRYMPAKLILKNVLDCIDMFLMRTEEDRDKIISLGAKPEKVKVFGNIKFDSADFNVNEEQRQEISNVLGLAGKRLIVAGSTHPGEEETLLKAYKNLKAKYDDLLLLIAPRHIERAEEIAKLVKSYGFSPVKVSEAVYSLQFTVYSYPVFILDTVGQLKLFYSISWAVFVGGSLIKHGGQNMIEPACFAKPILFGPHTFNFQDIANIFLEKNAAILVKDVASLEKAVEKLYKDDAFAKDTGARSREIVKENQGAAAKTIDVVKRIL